MDNYDHDDFVEFMLELEEWEEYVDTAEVECFDDSDYPTPFEWEV